MENGYITNEDIKNVDIEGPGLDTGDPGRGKIEIEIKIKIDKKDEELAQFIKEVKKEMENDNKAEKGDQAEKNGNGEEGNDEEDPFDTKKFKHLWIMCENCYLSNFKQFIKEKFNICERCDFHLQMDSSDRIEFMIDPGTWDPLDEDMVATDPIEFYSEGESYEDRIDYYQIEKGLTEAVQTGIGQLNGITLAIGIMDFQFIGGSMGSAVGEKITRLVEYATNQSLPLIIVCSSGGARMQEGTFSLMQMGKISCALYHYKLKKKVFYVSILASPTTGGVTASFGMSGDMVIAEPNAYIAFAGKRVIEETLHVTVPEGSQEAEFSFEKGSFDPIVPRNLLKRALGDLLKFHGFPTLTSNF
uniref:Acetyl-coenzyme A carboxylase carboxyl transferase subunit beta, chloroplastic n=1 Tax=Anchomanes hookeri TaxID=2544931 RepID=A0A6B9TYE9_9ARAE|nr:acetyl-CoA carboxylase beta subunit [Anchomanes hookeri]